MFKAVITKSSEEDSSVDGEGHSSTTAQQQQPSLSLPQQSGQHLIPLRPPAQQQIPLQSPPQQSAPQLNFTFSPSSSLPLQHSPLPLQNSTFPQLHHSTLPYPPQQSASLVNSTFQQTHHSPWENGSLHYEVFAYARTFIYELISKQQMLRKEQFLQLQDSAEPLMPRMPEAMQQPLLTQAERVSSYKPENLNARSPLTTTIPAHELDRDLIKFALHLLSASMGDPPSKPTYEWGRVRERDLLEHVVHRIFPSIDVNPGNSEPPATKTPIDPNIGRGLLISHSEYLGSTINIDVEGHQGIPVPGKCPALRSVSADINFIMKHLYLKNYKFGLDNVPSISYKYYPDSMPTSPSHHDIQRVTSYSFELQETLPGRGLPLGPNSYATKVESEMLSRLRCKFQPGDLTKTETWDQIREILKNEFASYTGDKYLLEKQPALKAMNLNDDASVNADIPDKESDSSTSENQLPVESNEEGKDLLVGVVDQIDQSGL